MRLRAHLFLSLVLKNDLDLRGLGRIKKGREMTQFIRFKSDFYFSSKKMHFFIVKKESVFAFHLLV